MTTFALLAALWSCAARSGPDKVYIGHGQTKREAEMQALYLCQKQIPVCKIRVCAESDEAGK